VPIFIVEIARCDGPRMDPASAWIPVAGNPGIHP
jgi:hypothetical protein